eukprot:725450-Rhodomonas_salina.5
MPVPGGLTTQPSLRRGGTETETHELVAPCESRPPTLRKCHITPRLTLRFPAELRPRATLLGPRWTVFIV